MHRERALDSDTEAHLAYGERLAYSGPLAADHDALEQLDPFLATLHDAHVHFERVAGPEDRHVLTQVRAIDEIGGVHDASGSSWAAAAGPTAGGTDSWGPRDP